MTTRARSASLSDPVDLIVAINRGRVPALVARKFAAMARDPFVFLRASAILGHRAIDLAALPATPVGWVCGDLHLQNFGCFRGSNRLVYFDLNDFDEAARLPVSVDLLRLLASIRTAAPDMGIANPQAHLLVREALGAYGGALARGKAFWLERDTATGPIGGLLNKVRKRKRSSLLASRTRVVGKRRQMIRDGGRYLPLPPESPARPQLRSALLDLAQLYGAAPFFDERDVAFRVAGMGSLGIPRYVALVRGKGDPGRNALIDFKFAVPSSAAQAMPQFAQPVWRSEAARVVAIQDACQAASPAYLSAVALGNEAYVVRELQPVEDRIALEPLAREKKTFDHTLRSMARLCAFAQLRSAGRLAAAGVDELMAFGQDILARPAPWIDAANAVAAANTAAFRAFQSAWTNRDPRLMALCSEARAAGGHAATARTAAARKTPARKQP